MKKIGRPRKPKPTRAPPRNQGTGRPDVLAAVRADPVRRAQWIARTTKYNQNRPHEATRFGIPHGMRRPEAENEWRFARMYAKEVTRIMVEEQKIPEDPKVEAAFSAAVEVLQSPMNQGIKLQAARLILDFLKAKPVAKSEVTVKNAEDWLAEVTADHVKKTEGDD